MTDHVHDGSVRSGHSAMRPLLLLALVALLLPTAGCRTFNSTQYDLERERKQLKGTPYHVTRETAETVRSGSN